MSNVLLEAQVRTDMGKGASRRLRRLENKVPAIIYGGNKDPISIHVAQNKLIKALETEKIYSSVFDITVDGKIEHVILKALQRHPYKAMVLHMDLQRVSPKDTLIKLIPIHFINEDLAKGVKAGGIINHSMTQVEVKCQAKDLPEFIECDMKDIELDDVVHLFDLKLPKGVQLSVDTKDDSHNHPVVSIHSPRVSQADIAEEEVVEVPADAVPATEEKEEGKE